MCVATFIEYYLSFSKWEDLETLQTHYKVIQLNFTQTFKIKDNGNILLYFLFTANILKGFTLSNIWYFSLNLRKSAKICLCLHGNQT